MASMRVATRQWAKVVLIAVLATGCGGGQSAAPPSSPEAASPPPAGAASENGGGASEDCLTIANNTYAQVERMLANARGATLGDVLAGRAITAEERGELSRLRQQARATGCEGRLRDTLRERADQIPGNGPLADTVRGALRSGRGLPF